MNFNHREDDMPALNKQQSSIHQFVLLTENKKFPLELQKLVNDIKLNILLLFQSQQQQDKELAAEISQLTYKLLTSEPGEKRQQALIPFVEKAQQLKSRRSKGIRTLGMSMLALAVVSFIAVIAVNIFMPAMLPLTYALVAVTIGMFFGGMAMYLHTKDSKDRAGKAMEHTATFFRKQDEEEVGTKEAESQPLLQTV